MIKAQITKCSDRKKDSSSSSPSLPPLSEPVHLSKLARIKLVGKGTAARGVFKDGRSHSRISYGTL